MGFARAAGAKVVFGLNICPRVPDSTSSTVADTAAAAHGHRRRDQKLTAGRAGVDFDVGAPRTFCADKSAGRWDPTNARALLEYTIASNQTFWGVELGNERNNEDTAKGQAADFAVLDLLLTELFQDTPSSEADLGAWRGGGDGNIDGRRVATPPNPPPRATAAAAAAPRRPGLLGPDTHSFRGPDPATAEYLAGFLKATEASNMSARLTAVTHHEYIEVDATQGERQYRHCRRARKSVHVREGR